MIKRLFILFIALCWSASAFAVTVGDTVDFTCTPSSGTAPYTYLWDFDDVTTFTGSAVTTQNPSHTFTHPGTFYVTVTVTDVLGYKAENVSIVEVVIDPDMPVANAVDDVGLDNTGTSDCTATLNTYITNNYDVDYGLEITFPAGTYKFEDTDDGTRTYGIKILQKPKIVLSGLSGVSRPTLQFYNNADSGHTWDAFIYMAAPRSAGNTYLHVKRLILENDLSARSEDLGNYTSRQDAIGNVGNDYADTYVTVEDCDIKDFSYVGAYYQAVLKRINVSGWGIWNSGSNVIEAIRLFDDSLIRRSYFNDGATGHSHIYYFTGVDDTNVIENYSDSKNAAESKLGASFKNDMTNLKFNWNIVRNTTSSAISPGAYDYQAYDCEFNDNRFIGIGGSGFTVNGSLSGLSALRNFFMGLTYDGYGLGNWTRCYTGVDVTGWTITDNVFGYDAPGGGRDTVLDSYGDCDTYQDTVIAWSCGGVSESKYSVSWSYGAISPGFRDIAVSGWTESGTTDDSSKFHTDDPAGWHDVDGYLDPGQWEYDAPTSCSVSSASPSGPDVTLDLSATDGGSGMSTTARFPFRQGALMQFSNDGTTWSEVRDYATTSAWTLPGAVGPYTVYAKFRDVDGNWSEAVSGVISFGSPLILFRHYME